MPFITSKGSFATNPYASVDPDLCRAYIVLAHPTIADFLVLHTHDSEPYNRSLTGWYKSDGRSIQGGLRVIGTAPNPERWTGNFAVTLPQLDLFNSLLQVQKTSVVPVSINDRWIPGRSRDANVFLDVDDRYLTLLSIRGHWHKLQFVAEEVI